MLAALIVLALAVPGQCVGSIAYFHGWNASSLNRLACNTPTSTPHNPIPPILSTPVSTTTDKEASLCYVHNSASLSTPAIATPPILASPNSVSKSSGYNNITSTSKTWHSPPPVVVATPLLSNGAAPSNQPVARNITLFWVSVIISHVLLQ